MVFSLFFKYISNSTHRGFYFLCLVFSRGFYFWFYLIACLYKKIFKNSKIGDKLVRHYKARQERPEYFFLLLFTTILFIATIYVAFYDSNEVVSLEEMVQEREEVVEEDGVLEPVEQQVQQQEDNKPPLETNLYKIYGNKNINQINFNELRKVNGDVKAWIIVDGTNINYPVVQTNNNNYYLKHNINKKKTSNGWPFIDYRNNSSMSDDNTIFYGHNLLNKTAFGSISNLFNKSWVNNSSHKILVLTDSKLYTYEIFSIYYSDPTSYYLQTKFYTTTSKFNFFSSLKQKSIVDLPATISENDKIITLSTCTDDNKGRKVVHAKLISISNR